MKNRYRILYDKTNIGEKYYVVQRRRWFIWYSLGYNNDGELLIWVRDSLIEKRFSEYDYASDALKKIIKTDCQSTQCKVMFETTKEERG